MLTELAHRCGMALKQRGLQVATVLRLLATVWAVQAPTLLLAAATVWLVVLGAWGVRYGRWYGRPRVDGRPG